MPRSVKPATPYTPCKACPISSLPGFQAHTSSELAFIAKLKIREIQIEPRATVFLEGTHSAHFYTVLAGWVFRYKLLEDGRRQVLNYALPGDLIGLQGSVLGKMGHSIEGLTRGRLCVFEKERLSELFQAHSGLAYDITWLASREERILDENLLSIGRRSALERAAYLLAHLHARALRADAYGEAPILPLTQQLVADTLGLSIVHVNKTLRKLAKAGLISWVEGGCVVLDASGLRETAGWRDDTRDLRPFI